MPAPLTVAIDARPLAQPGSDGYDYTLHLIHALAYVDQDTRFQLYFDREPDAERLPRAANVTAAILDAPGRLWKASALPGAAEQAGADLLHVQGLLPAGCRLPVVTTLRHLGPLARPRAYPGSVALAWRAMLPRQLRGAAAVITPWRAVARDVERRLGVEPERITVTPYGVEPTIRPQCETAQKRIRDQLGLPSRYLYARIAPDTDLAPVMATWRAAQGSLGQDLSLVLAESGPSEPGVTVLPAIDPQLKPGLVCGAVATVLGGDDDASVLTLLESLACGMPAVGPPSAVLEEAAGKLVTLGDAGAQAAAIARIAGDPDYRALLLRGCLARAKAFTWPAMAERTLAVYRAAGGQRGRRTGGQPAAPLETGGQR